MRENKEWRAVRIFNMLLAAFEITYDRECEKSWGRSYKIGCANESMKLSALLLVLTLLLIPHQER